jgi:hypothetical protein
MAEIDLTEAIMGDYQMIWRGVEKRRFEVDRRILEVHNKNIPDEFSVDFSEPRFPLTADEERKQWDWEWANGLSSPKDWLRKYNPDLTEEEISEMAEEIQVQQPAQEENAGDVLAQALSS